MHWRMLPLFMAFIGLAHFNRLSMSVAGAEQIIPSEILSAQEMGLVYSAFLVVYTIGMIPGGWFIDRFGPRNAWLIVIFGSAVFVTGTGVLGWALAGSSLFFVALVVLRGAYGIVSSPLHPTGARLVANWTPPEATDFVNGSINGAALLGIAFTFLGFGELIDLCGWPGAFLVMGGITFVLGIVWAAFGADHPPGGGHAPIELARYKVPVDYRRVFTDSSLLILTLSYGLLGYFQYLFFYWAEYYFSHELRLSTADSRWATTQLSLAMAGGMFAGGWLSDVIRRRLETGWSFALLPMLSLFSAGAATFAGLYGRSNTEVIACFALAMGAAGMCEGAYWSTAIRLGRDYGGTAAAIMNTGGNALGLVAPALTPWISAHFGWRASLVLAASVCWIAALGWLGVREKKS